MSEPVFEFTGDLLNGETVIVNMETKTVTVDDVIVFTFDGDFFDFYVGGGGVAYADDEGARSLSTTITHKDRFV